LDALERSLKAFAGAAAAGFGGGIVDVNLFQASTVTILERSASLAGISLLLSVASVKADGISPASVVPPGA